MPQYFSRDPSKTSEQWRKQMLMACLTSMKATYGTQAKKTKKALKIVGIPEKIQNPIQSSKAPSVERYFVMLGRCNIRGGFEARGSCILSRTYCWILLKSSLLLHTCLYMPHAHGESVFTVYTIQTALHCFNSSIHILLCCKGRLER